MTAKKGADILTISPHLTREGHGAEVGSTNNVHVLPIIAEVVFLVKTRDAYSPCHEEQRTPHRRKWKDNWTASAK